jgi:hypothetical protein
MDTLLTLGVIHQRIGDRRPALECFTAALRLARSGGTRYAEAMVLVHLAEAHTAWGDDEDAESHRAAAAALAASCGYGLIERRAALAREPVPTPAP